MGLGSTIKCRGETHRYTFFSFSFSFNSLIADGPHHYHPACGHKGSSRLSPVHALHFFYRDASSALLQLVDQWLNFTYSRSHAFRYERKNTNPTLVRIELTTSVLADGQLTYAHSQQGHENTNTYKRHDNVTLGLGLCKFRFNVGGNLVKNIGRGGWIPLRLVVILNEPPFPPSRHPTIHLPPAPVDAGIFFLLQ